jgi:hypothetical protein
LAFAGTTKIIFDFGLQKASPSLRGAKRRSKPSFRYAALWIASRSLSSGAQSRDPLACNDGKHTIAASAQTNLPIGT